MKLNLEARKPERRRAVKLSLEERRAQLLKCAVQVFARKGIASAGHADVAAEAGVAVPTVFSYFPTRPALVEAVVNEVERVILGRAFEATLPYKTVPEQFLAVLREFADTFDVDPAYARIWVNWSTSFQDDIWPLYERFVDATVELHRGIIHGGLARGEPLQQVDPQMSAYQFMGAASVIVQMKMQRRLSKNIHKYLEAAMHGALHQV